MLFVFCYMFTIRVLPCLVVRNVLQNIFYNHKKSLDIKCTSEHFEVLFPFVTYHRVCNYINTGVSLVEQ